jgi:glycolate oxidase FAD binding subunit
MGDSPYDTDPIVKKELAAACSFVAEAGPSDSIAGVEPRWVASPASTEETAAVLRVAASRDLAVVPRGSGSRLDWGRPPERCDLILDTRRMDQVVEHTAGDLVARVQAGATMGHVAEVLARAGQRISLGTPPEATVGGVIADGVAGPLRLRFGGPRDLIIGITVVRADGVVARSGGKVVKNVAGYDLGKLFAGSRGTLGVITEATFRLHPIPSSREWVVATLPAHVPWRTDDVTSTLIEEGRCDIDHLASGGGGGGGAGGGPAGGGGAGTGGGGADVGRVVAAAANSPLLASAVEVYRGEPGGPVEVGVLLEGTGDGVAARAELMAGLLGDGTVRYAEKPQWWGRTESGVRVSFWVSALPAVLAAVDEAAAEMKGAEAGVRPVVGGSAGAGVLDVWFDGDPGAFAAALRARVGVRGSVIVLAPYTGDALGPVPGLTLMRAVKDRFDPGHRMAPGRLAEGL